MAPRRCGRVSVVPLLPPVTCRQRRRHGSSDWPGTPPGPAGGEMSPTLRSTLVWRGTLFGAVAVVTASLVASAVQVSRWRTEALNPAGIDWVQLPAGAFVMGSADGKGEEDEHPARKKKVRAFALSRTEITVAQYRRCVRAGVCTPARRDNRYCNTRHKGRGDHPINCVDWVQAATFCAWAGGRLPTETEWEYAARSGGQDIEYPWGDTPEPTCDNVVMDLSPGNACGQDSTWPACSRPSGNSAQGICDLAGNVNEWMADCHTPYSQGEERLFARSSAECNLRSLRGGGTGCKEGFRARNRLYHDPAFAYGGLGIRCALGPWPTSASSVEKAE